MLKPKHPQQCAYSKGQLVLNPSQINQNKFLNLVTQTFQLRLDRNLNLFLNLYLDVKKRLRLGI